MLDKILDAIEKTDSRVVSFILGILAALLVGWAAQSRRSMVNKKEILEHKANKKSALADNSERSDLAQSLVEEASVLRSKSDALDGKIHEVSERISKARRRINDARSISDLDNL